MIANDYLININIHHITNMKEGKIKGAFENCFTYMGGGDSILNGPNRGNSTSFSGSYLWP